LALPHPRQAMRVCQHDLPVEYSRQLALFRPFRKGRLITNGAAAVPQNGWPIWAEIGYAQSLGRGKRV